MGKLQCVGNADGMWTENDHPEWFRGKPERIRYREFLGTVQQFRAQMQRLFMRCADLWGSEIFYDERLRGLIRKGNIGLWKSSDEDLLGFWEERQREYPTADSQEALDFAGDLSEVENYVDVTPSTRSTWAVYMFRREKLEEGSLLLDEHGEDTGWVRVHCHIEKEGGYAGIEAYEHHDGTQVYFLDGYDPVMAMEGIPAAVLPPIGPLFLEFCDWVIQEVWGETAEPPTSTEASARSCQEAEGSFAMSNRRKSDASRNKLRDLIEEGEELGIPEVILCELRELESVLDRLPNMDPIQTGKTILRTHTLQERILTRLLPGLEKGLDEERRIEKLYNEKVQGVLSDLKHDLGRLEAMIEATEPATTDDDTDERGVVDIDRLLSDVSRMRQHYKGYNPITAREIIEAAPRAARSFCEEGGRWGPSKFEPFCGVTSVTIGRYFKAFRAVGLKETPDGIRLPGPGVREPY